MDKKALVINLYAGPSSGKSTAAAWLFTCLKKIGYNVELVTEYAKDKVWEESHTILNNQILLFAKQHHRIKRLLDKVEIVITDSPIMMGISYDFEKSIHLRNLAFYEYNKMDNLNFYLNRSTSFKQEGRTHTEDESIKMDKIIKDNLDEFNIDYKIYSVNDSGYNDMLNTILDKIK